MVATVGPTGAFQNAALPGSEILRGLDMSEGGAAADDSDFADVGPSIRDSFLDMAASRLGVDSRLRSWESAGQGDDFSNNGPQPEPHPLQGLVEDETLESVIKAEQAVEKVDEYKGGAVQLNAQQSVQDNYSVTEIGEEIDNRVADSTEAATDIDDAIEKLEGELETAEAAEAGPDIEQGPGMVGPAVAGVAGVAMSAIPVVGPVLMVCQMGAAMASAMSGGGSLATFGQSAQHTDSLPSRDEKGRVRQNEQPGYRSSGSASEGWQVAAGGPKSAGPLGSAADSGGEKYKGLFDDSVECGRVELVEQSLHELQQAKGIVCEFKTDAERAADNLDSLHENANRTAGLLAREGLVNKEDANKLAEAGDVNLNHVKPVDPMRGGGSMAMA